MHREGIDPEQVQPEDILCDYCHRAAWAAEEPCVEGHQGSIVCGECLTLAYSDLVLQKTERKAIGACRMCLEDREDSSWHGIADPTAFICKRCVKQSAGVLQKSTHWDWTKPTSV